MSTQRFFSVMDGDREVASVTLLTSAALEWNDDRNRRIVNQVSPKPDGSWTVIRQVTADELLGALRG
jgi:hypothetical protein